MRREGLLTTTSVAKEQMLSSLIAQDARGGVSIGSVTPAKAKPSSPEKAKAVRAGAAASPFEKANSVVQHFGVDYQGVRHGGREGGLVTPLGCSCRALIA